MDPNANLRELLAAILARDFDRAQELAEALDTWLRRDGFSPIPTQGTRYQGWRNHETFAIHMFLTGDRDTDNQCRALLRRAIVLAATSVPVVKGDWTVDQARQYLLADYLKDYVDGHSPLADEASVYSDLLGCTIRSRLE